MTDALDEFQKLADKTLWRDITSAPTDQFILLWCAEDNSRWFAKWQGVGWYGVDDNGLTRCGSSAGNANTVTGWFVNAWMPLPDAPSLIGRNGKSAVNSRRQQ